MTWDAHTNLHQKDTEPDICSECAINKKHAERWEEALALGPVTPTQATKIGELHRQDWVDWKPTDDSPTTRHDKAKRIEAFVVAHHGEDVTLEQIMQETEAAKGTAYAYVRDMTLSFRRIGTSLYRVSDPVRTRAETLSGAAPTLTQDRSDIPAAMVAADIPKIEPQRLLRGPSLP